MYFTGYFRTKLCVITVLYICILCVSLKSILFGIVLDICDNVLSLRLPENHSHIFKVLMLMVRPYFSRLRDEPSASKL